MKYLKLFEYYPARSNEDKNLDIILDVFLEYADKWKLEFVGDITDYYINIYPDIDNFKTCYEIEYYQQNYLYYIDILLFRNMDSVSEEFKDDMEKFCNRLGKFKSKEGHFFNDFDKEFNGREYTISFSPV